jgi:hypothetical protein
MPSVTGAEDASRLAGTQVTPSPGESTNARRRRGADAIPAGTLRMPAPLNQLPWEVAKDQFSPQGADFIGTLLTQMTQPNAVLKSAVLGAVMIKCSVRFAGDG